VTEPDPRKPIEFDSVRLGPPRRRIDPLVVGLGIALAALVLAVVKPWGDGVPGIAVGPSPVAPSSSAQPSVISTRGALVPPTWTDVRSVISRRESWGIRTIVLASGNAAASASPGTSERYAERWVPTDIQGGKHAAWVLDGASGPIVALGVTFPPEETPLDVRIWLEHAGGDLEWMDARPVNDVPARGAYLFGRPGMAGAAVRSWAPGRYRIDVLVSGGIRRMVVEIPEPSGTLPEPPVWTEGAPAPDRPDEQRMVGLPVGPFVLANGAVTPLSAWAGPTLDETGAWLDVDAGETGGEPRSFVARAYQPRATWIGVILPPSSTVQSMLVRRLAPFDDPMGVGGESMAGSAPDVSYVAFAPRGSATWHPGVYALSVAWADARGLHDETWHVELRPGQLSADPVLLSATRAWARYAGSSGVLLGTTESLDAASQAAGIRLLEIAPQAGADYPGLRGRHLIGCGETVIRGRPTLVGVVGPVGMDLAPVTANLLFPFADSGPLPVLTASGAVPGLALVSPVLTAEYGGPAAYGFRAGSGGDAPGYTICVGLTLPAR
jgi:hypothetical protein